VSNFFGNSRWCQNLIDAILDLNGVIAHEGETRDTSSDQGLQMHGTSSAMESGPVKVPAIVIFVVF